jgi:Kef-type K+ transport system membrane component KefB
LLLALVLSFSSTVFAVKALQESGEMGALHGRVAVGILIMQDLIAVMFLTASTGKLPSWMSIGLLVGLLALSPAMGWLMERSGHGGPPPWRPRRVRLSMQKRWVRALGPGSFDLGL